MRVYAVFPPVLPARTNPRPRNAALKMASWLVGLVALCGCTFDAACGEISFTVCPYLQSVTENSIIVCWESNAASDGTIEYWIQGSQQSMLITVDSAQRHEVPLSGLQPGTCYGYRVRIPAEGLGTNFTAGFRTALTEDAPFSFAVYGDSRERDEEDQRHKSVVDCVRAFSPAFVIHLGDIVNIGGSPYYWNIFWTTVAPPSGEESLAGNVPLYPVIGNHEYFARAGGYSDEAIETYQSYFVVPPNGLESEHPEWADRFYSFRYGPALFIILDVNNDSDPDYDLNTALTEGPPDIHPGSPQYEWLINLLSTARAECAFTFVCFHHSPYSSGPYGKDAPMKMRFLDPVFRQYGVDAVFTSHDHVYERCETCLDGYPIHYFVEGAGGANLYARAVGWDQPGSWMWDEANLTYYTKAFDNASYSFIRVDMVPLGGGAWRATFSATRANGEVFDVIQIRRPWARIAFGESLAFSFESTPGKNYLVEYSHGPAYSESGWHSLGAPVLAEGAFSHVTDDGTETGAPPSAPSVKRRFYRAIELP